MSDLLLRVATDDSITVVDPQQAARARRWAARLEESVANNVIDALVDDGYLAQRVAPRFVERSYGAGQPAPAWRAVPTMSGFFRRHRGHALAVRASTHTRA